MIKPSAFPDPAGTLETLRGLLRTDGMVLITELRCEEEFSAPGNVREQTYFGWSGGYFWRFYRLTP